MITYILIHSIVVIWIMKIYLYIFKLKINQIKRRLMNKHVVVVGGSSGIGKSIALLAAKNGAHVTIVARNIDKLEVAVDLLQKVACNSSQRLKYVSVDCSDWNKVENVFDELDNSSPVYMLVNCSGISIPGEVENVSDEDIKKMIDSNLYAIFYPTKAMVPKMKLRRNGVIIIVGSQASLIGIYGLSIYSAVKFALKGFAESLHMELHNYNVDITFAMPPDTETPGFFEENKRKPEITKIICATGGLYEPDTVAERIMKDALDNKFFSFVGAPSFCMTLLCSGMSPANSLWHFLLQFLFMGHLRLLGWMIKCSFYRTVRKFSFKK